MTANGRTKNSRNRSKAGAISQAIGDGRREAAAVMTFASWRNTTGRSTVKDTVKQPTGALVELAGDQATEEMAPSARYGSSTALTRRLPLNKRKNNGGSLFASGARPGSCRHR